MVLPTELVDHIFSFLQKDISALKKCSKALPLYSRLAERHIYAHTVIDPQAPEVCNDILEIPHLLDYPRTLEIRCYLHTRNPLVISVMSVIPRMANLVSLKIHSSGQFDEEFFTTFRNCLQQSSFQELHLFDICNIPSLSFLDDAKNIKRLTLSNCFVAEKPISGSPSSQLFLETLVLYGYSNPYLHLWATRWVTLTTLELHDLWLSFDWTVLPELLAACSNSLTRFHLDMGYWDGRELPFTLSALKHLKKLSIYVLVVSAAEDEWALPEIIRVVNTTPAMPDVVLQFHCRFSNSITFLAQLDWSPLNHFKSNIIGKAPRIDLCLTDSTLPETVQDALAANEVLNDLVKQGLVIISSLE